MAEHPPLDVNDFEHQRWRARIDELVAEHRAVIELDSVDLTEPEVSDVQAGAA